MFPSASSRIYRNDAGEPVGWDSTYYDEPEYEPDDYLPVDEGYDFCDLCGEDLPPDEAVTVKRGVADRPLVYYVHQKCADFFIQRAKHLDGF